MATPKLRNVVSLAQTLMFSYGIIPQPVLWEKSLSEWRRAVEAGGLLCSPETLIALYLQRLSDRVLESQRIAIVREP